MPDVIGIRFKSCGKIYDFEVGNLEVKRGDTVVVDSDMGLSTARVVMERHESGETAKELKKVLRKLSEEDIKQKEENKSLEEEAGRYCAERITARSLPMKLISTETTLDRKRIVFYFISDNRIDFRELVKDLAAKFRTRIEMRQVGVRDEAKIIGGFGMCGRELCCRTFLTTFEPISIKMAKSQDLSLNASKLSGLCGRLMCCLGYEFTDKTEECRGRTLSQAGEKEVPVEIAEGPQPSAGNRDRQDMKTQAPADKGEAAGLEGLQKTEGADISSAAPQKPAEAAPGAGRKFKRFRNKHRRRHKK